MKNLFIAAALTGFLFADASQAAMIGVGTEIGIDFGPAAQAASGGFNSYQTSGGIATGAVLDTSGVVVDGVDVITTVFAFTNTDPSPSAGQITALGALGFTEEHITDFSGQSGSGFVVFRGLDPSLTYKVEVVSLFQGTHENNVILQRNAASPVTIDTSADLAIATFHNISLITDNPAEPNSINIEILPTPGSTPGGTAFYNAIRVTAIPEPGSLSILGSVGLVMLFRWHGKSQRR